MHIRVSKITIILNDSERLLAHCILLVMVMAAHGICLLLRCEGSEGITRPGCSCPLPQDPMSAAPGEHLTLPQLPTAQPSLATGPAERGYLQADSLAKPQPGPTGDA